MKQLRKFATMAIILMLTTFTVVAQTQQDSFVSEIDTSVVNLEEISKELINLTYLPDTFLVENDGYTVATFVNPGTGEILAKKEFRQKVSEILEKVIASKHPGRDIAYLKPNLPEGDNRKMSVYRTYRNTIPFLYTIDFHLPGSEENDNEDFILAKAKYYFTYITIRKYE